MTASTDGTGQRDSDSAISPAEVIGEMEALGIRLWENEGQLRFRAPTGVLTEERRDVLRKHKQAILETLRAGTQPEIVANPDQRYEPFPLSELQTAYLVGRREAFQFGGVGCQVYNEFRYPELDIGRLESAWSSLLRRHDMLRVRIDERGFQQVLPEIPSNSIAVGDLRGVGEPQRHASIDALRTEMIGRVYDAGEWPMFDLRVTRDDDASTLHVSIDMLIADYLSIQRVLGELALLYDDPELELAPLDLTFRDYLLAQRRTRERPEYERDRSYWIERLDNLPLAPELPVRASSDEPPGFERWAMSLPVEDWQALRARASEHRVTPSAAVLSAFSEVIGRWSRQPRFTVNVTLLNRLALHPQVDQLVGDFTGVNLLTVDQSHRAGFGERAHALQSQLWEDMDHALFSGVDTLRELGRRRGQAAALMPIVYTSTLGLVRDQESARNRGELVYARSQTPQVWIDCQVREPEGQLQINWDVRDGVFIDGVIDDMFAAFADLLTRLARDPDAWSEEAPVGLPSKQRERRRQVNDTSAPVAPALLHDAFVERARQAPDDPAVIASDRTLSYGYLLVRACGVAGVLHEAGCRPGDLVAIVMDKGWEQVVGVLGSLLAGAAYLPLEADQPHSRRDLLLSDAGVRHVLTQSWHDGDWPPDIVATTVDSLGDGAQSMQVPAATRKPDDLAYVIYTSGSTGRPKGVMITHQSAWNTIVDVNGRFGVGPGDRVLGLANLGFDLSVYDLFGPLACGGAIVLPRADRRGDPSHWAQLVAAHGVTVWNSVPAQMDMLHQFLTSETSFGLATLRLALLSGDWIPLALPDDVATRLPDVRVVSLGGATEASIWSIFFPIDAVDPAWQSVPYGKPLTNQTFDVLDRDFRPCPDWTVGELYIGGAGVALGYLGDDALTAERFIVHPETGERLYRTGDLGRYLPDGNIEFLGREDRQVKIRGHRIELAEVEAAMQVHPAVRSAVALVDGGTAMERRIVGFVEARQSGAQEREGTVSAARLEDAARGAGDAVRAGVDSEQFADFVEQLDEVALLGMLNALQHCGLFTTPEAEHSVDEVLELAAVASNNHRLIRGWLTVLEEEGKLRRDAGSGALCGARGVDDAEIEAAWNRIGRSDLDVDFNTDMLSYLRLSASHLPELVRNEVNAVELVFPEGRVEVWEAAYKDNLLSRYVNQTAGEILRLIALDQAATGPLRVLELGAGVGGASSELIPILDEFDVDYLFTDISQFFINDARERFSDYPWVRYGLLDINADYRPQGLAPNSFEVIVSAHVLHYGRDIAVVLRRLRELLVPDGWIVFIDLTHENYQMMTSMMFMGGGGDFEDVRRGSNKSFITRDQWLALLADAGADDIVELPGPDDVFAPLGQHVFAARFKQDRMRVAPAELQRYLTDHLLPEYMVPSWVQVIDALPLTDNGKIDHKTLHSWLPREAAQHIQFGAEPETDLERRIAAQLAELLGVAHVARDEGFFELGGDSLLATRLVTRLREVIPEAADILYDDLVRQFLAEPTVAALAGYLSRGRAKDAAADGDAPSPVVSLREGTGPARVLVHDGSGGLHGYGDLVTALPDDGLTLGLVVPRTEMFLELDPRALLQRTGGDYAAALLEQRGAPFRLIGHDLGALIALETAVQLLDRGGEVDELVVICDRPLTLGIEDPLLVEYLFARSAGADPASAGFPPPDALRRAVGAVLAETPGLVPDGRLASLDSEETLTAVAKAFRRLARRPSHLRAGAIQRTIPVPEGDGSASDYGHGQVVFEHTLQAAAGYQAPTYPGDIVLVHSGPGLDCCDDVVAFWQQTCLGDLQIIEVSAGALGCLHAPVAQEIVASVFGGQRVR